jgi:Fe-S-cluster containining protein
VQQGIVQHNKERPYFIARDDDGYCPHLDREKLHCTIWQNRPLRCRRYQCHDDENVWPEGIPDDLKVAFSDMSKKR